MDSRPMMTLEGQRSSALQEAPKMTFSVELSMADSTVDGNLTLKDTTDSLLSVIDDQTPLELKNKSSLEKINQIVPVLMSKDGPCLRISNLLTKEKTKKCIKHKTNSAQISSPKHDMNGFFHESDLQLYSEAGVSCFLTSSDSSVTNDLDVHPSNISSTSPFSCLTVRSISDPAHYFASSPLGPPHLEHPHSAHLPVSKGTDLPRIIKHKPSSITFADYDSFLGLIQNAQAIESSDACESSSEDEGRGDEVFPECKEFLPGSRRNRGGLEKQKVKGTCGQASGEESSSTNLPPTSTSSYEAEEESSSTRVRMQ
ncbi:hypothetical protein R3I93_004334 [Phoxinus phoxinus]|uniref:Uncharacterized protein n=1 Tax=Phoxinus phoxinus TaxID=58324 RepID=A0AAN9DF26_9TELE